jgi:hypothetical protein
MSFASRLLFVFALAALVAPARTLHAQDWLQLGANAARTNYASAAVSPPYRARWIWCGPDRTLRNKAANPQWPDDLRLGHGKGADYPLPAAVPFTFAGRVQPVVAGTTVFVADMDGKVYAIALTDGKTLWVGDNPRGTCGTAAVVDGVVVVTSIPGALAGLNAQTGKPRWRLETPKAITGSVLAVAGSVFTGCHDGRVYAVEAGTGKRLWTSDNLGAPIVADLCADESAIYVGAENLYFHKLDLRTGKLLVRTRLVGQSFRMTHPMLHQDLLFVQTVQGPCVGSEYIMEGVLRDSPSPAAEQQNILRWLKGDTNGGRWKDASPAWKHLHVLRTSDLGEPFVVPNGPADGCGAPCPSPCVDSQGRVLTWFKTAFPALTAKGSFGTKYSMDISAIDLQTGLRQPIDNGRLSGTTGEADNLFALSCAGQQLYLRQPFRGTRAIDLGKSTAYMIQAAVRVRDGGTWNADVVYRESGGLPRTSQPPLAGRVPPTIAGGLLLFAEPYCITAVEHR